LGFYQMKVLANLKVVRSLATDVQKQLKSRGVRLQYHAAVWVVAQTFGYNGIEQMHQALETERPDAPDNRVDGVELRRRRDSYERALSAVVGVPLSDARAVIGAVGVQGWWGITEARLSELAEFLIDEIRPSGVKVTFSDTRIPRKLARSLNIAAREHDLAIVGRNDLVAKLFGYECFRDLEEGLNADGPDDKDWDVSEEQMKLRIGEYLRILTEAGFSVETAVKLLRTVGIEGWWEFENRPLGAPVESGSRR
jgi:hypothetical protein